MCFVVLPGGSHALCPSRVRLRTVMSGRVIHAISGISVPKLIVSQIMHLGLGDPVVRAVSAKDTEPSLKTAIVLW